MLKNWQFNILFFVGVAGAILLVIGPKIGLDLGQNPTAVTGLGAILTYVLTQKNSITKKDQPPKKRRNVLVDENDHDEEEASDEH